MAFLCDLVVIVAVICFANRLEGFAARYENCYDLLTDSVHGVPWSDQKHTGTTWGNGYRCRGSGEELSDNPKFCTSQGWTCAAYEAKGWCFDGYPDPSRMTWTTGPGLHEPENACCACGGGICVTGEDCWETLGGLALEQGSGVSSIGLHRWHTLQSCKKLCNGKPECNSFEYSASAGGHCHLKDRCITEDTPMVPHAEQSRYQFHTYYKRCQSPPVAAANTSSSPTVRPPAPTSDSNQSNSTPTVLSNVTPTSSPTLPFPLDINPQEDTVVTDISTSPTASPTSTPTASPPAHQIHSNSYDARPTPAPATHEASRPAQTGSFLSTWGCALMVLVVIMLGAVVAGFCMVTTGQSSQSKRFVMLAREPTNDQDEEDVEEADDGSTLESERTSDSLQADGGFAPERTADSLRVGGGTVHAMRLYERPMC